MGVLRQFLRHPHQLWFRRCNFQIHLWTGVILALYLVVIGVTGSILVFGAELEQLVNPSPWPRIDRAQRVADLATVVHSLATRYPHTHIVSITAPTSIEPVFTAVLQTAKQISVACQPSTGEVLGEINREPSRLQWIYDLHENLLAQRSGRVANGIGALALLLMALTGLINWWPGLQSWRRALSIDFRRRWRRVNYDIHSAVGFWTLALLVVWASSGVYFTWPDRFLALVNHLSPLVNSRPPMVVVHPNTDIAPLDFRAMLAKAYAVDPGARWEAVFFPASRRSPFEMLMSRSTSRDREDTLFFNPYNGQYISTWQYGVNKSLGDWIVWLQVPLHFGTHWGLAFKCLWAAFGLALPVLAITGLLMYWNRFLSKKWPAANRRFLPVSTRKPYYS